MIGQERNKEQVAAWKDMDNLPRTLMITGARGSGKRTLASYIAEQFGFDVRWIGNKVNDVRDMIADCRSLSKPTMFVFVGADDMSLSAKNSLLKVTEEPPNDAYFVIPLEDAGNTLATIKSRSIELQMEPYTHAELAEFSDNELCLTIATSPGEIIELEKAGVDNLVEIVEKVVDNVYDVSSGNALNIAKNVKFKDEDEGYPLDVFWRVLNVRLVNRIMTNLDRITMSEVQLYSDWISITQRYLNYIGNASLNKRMIFDMWLFDIRNEVK